MEVSMRRGDSKHFSASVLRPALALLVLAFSPLVFAAHGFSQALDKRGAREVVSVSVVRQAVGFDSGGETIRGWLYLPKKPPAGKKAPAIVTANALTGIKEINLPEYALRFAEAGFFTLIFDHRYWGESGGTPRFHVAPMEQREDIQSAISFLTRQPEIDPGRIGGWGISMGGGNMLFLASWEPRLRAVVAVSTGISPPKEGTLLTPGETRSRYNELLEASRVERRGRSSAGITTLQAWCPAPAEGCALPVKEAYDFYENARASYAPAFENRITSTSFQNMVADDSAFAIHLAGAPILIIHPDQDVVPVEHVLFYYKRAPEPKHLIVPSGLHTTTYAGGKHLEFAARESIAWFTRYLGGGS
jgi:fermentation-respiration switch protein FrsA (DUF1100 family)